MSSFHSEYKKLAQSLIDKYPAHHILIFGRPGAGKGGLAEVFAELGFHHVGVGRLIRQHINDETELSERFESELGDKLIVPDSLAADMVFPELRSIFSKDRACFALEGYPVTSQQYEDFIEFIHKHDLKLVVVWLDIPESVGTQRLLDRKTCSICHRTYSSGAEKCTMCQATLTARYDDNEDTIRKRQELFEQKTLPLVDKIKADYPIFHHRFRRKIELEKP